MRSTAGSLFPALRSRSQARAVDRRLRLAAAVLLDEDAVRIAVNIIRYAMLQAISYKSEVQPIR